MKLDERSYEPSEEANEDVLREAYYKLGQLSTSFAEMEEGVHGIISGLISDDEIIASYLIDKNGLDQNLQLLRKINEYKEFEVAKVKNVVDAIENVKGKRNELIHGVWSVRIIKSDNTPMIFVGSYKMVRIDTVIKGKKGWASKTFKAYKFNEISETIETIKLVIENLKELTNILHNLS